jgi:hypothetical protein
MSRLRLHREGHLVGRIGWLRAAVLGANDGIVSTASLIVGVAAAAATQNDILIAGVAGLVAGAMSMAAGEYVSVSSQSDTEKVRLFFSTPYSPDVTPALSSTAPPTPSPCRSGRAGVYSFACRDAAGQYCGTVSEAKRHPAHRVIAAARERLMLSFGLLANGPLIVVAPHIVAAVMRA